MSYVIDVYRRESKPARNLVEFATFVSFFPHLVAGPIMRSTSLLPQVAARRSFDLDQFYRGSYLVFWGLFKKVVVADNLALIVNELFGRSHELNGGLALLAIYAFAFQIYADFSGYTDIARGVARCLGFELVLNFNLPYFANSPADFWGRWHISLSSWLRDYVYIPLGGNRGGPSRTCRNVMLTMLIGGLWHGAAVTFLIWGLYHGALLAVEKLVAPSLTRLQPRNPLESTCWSAIRVTFTFHLICFGWLIFRSQSIEQLMELIQAIVHRPAIPHAAYLTPVVITIAPLWLFELAQYVARDLHFMARSPWYVRSAFYTACFYAIVLAGEFGGQQFIYFQF